MAHLGRLAAAAALALVAGLAAPYATAHAHGGHHAPEVTELVDFGALGAGSTVGPDRRLYVTNGAAGQVLRVDPRSGDTEVFAHGLPQPLFPIGGAIDVAFLGKRAYVLVTLVGPVFGQPDVVNGLYKVRRDGSVKPVVDLGTWSVENPPAAGGEAPSGLQYAMQPYGKGFLITDGNHNRVLWVSPRGHIEEVATFDNVVPTGLETIGRLVLLSLAGPVPHDPEDGRIVAGWRPHQEPVEVASGAPLLVDVEKGPRHRLYALSQGSWDLEPTEENAGAPATPETGALLKVRRNGSLHPVVEGLDQPTSMEFIGRHAYVVTLSGSLLRVG